MHSLWAIFRCIFIYRVVIIASIQSWQPMKCSFMCGCVVSRYSFPRPPPPIIITQVASACSREPRDEDALRFALDQAQRVGNQVLNLASIFSICIADMTYVCSSMFFLISHSPFRKCHWLVSCCIGSRKRNNWCGRRCI